MAVQYQPPLSVAGFLTSTAFGSLIVGPVGSTKTTGGIMKIAYHAAQMAPCRDGVRRSRCVWIRNTREQLRDTSIPDFLKWFPDGDAGIFAKTEYKFLLKFADVECEVLFRGLDDANDVRRLLSLQASFAVVEEFREIHKDIFEGIQSRLGRYPDGMMVPHRPEWGLDDKGNPIMGCVTDQGKSNKHIWGMSNPPDMDTYWEELLSHPPSNFEVFFQPSGLSTEADWIHYLPSNYYEDLVEGKSEAWVDVYVHAKFGKSLAGRPVFPTFKPDWHVAKEPLKAIRMDGYPLLIGMDFGLTPAAVIGQVDPWARLLCLDELTSEGMGALRFAQEKLKPLLARKYPGYPVIIIGDPAGAQRAQTDEKTVFEVLRAQRLNVIGASSNNLAKRLAAVEAHLGRAIDGKPGFLVDPGCRELIRALRGGYRYKVKAKSQEVDDSPEKNAYSHISDALQYLSLHADGGRSFGVNNYRPAAQAVETVNHHGWT
jgi:hypothetical protein